jgi:hypothetical protein
MVSDRAAEREEPADGPDAERDIDERTGRAAAVERIRQKTLWVDTQIREAMARGEFDNLPGAGKPIKGLDRADPDWWLKGLAEREQLSGLLPPALALRNEDAGLDAQLDRESSEQVVRDLVKDFNRRIIDARRQLLGGPPVITPTRDVDHEIERWRERRADRLATRRRQGDREPRTRRANDAPHAGEAVRRPRRGWFASLRGRLRSSDMPSGHDST